MNGLSCCGSKPLSCGSDRSVRLWRVNDESHLVYRGKNSMIDCVSMLTPDLFVSGDEGGHVSLWKQTQKRPIATIHGAHGTLDDLPADNDQRNRWIASLAAVPMSDVFASGSHDGYIRLWSVNEGAPKDSKLRPLWSVPARGFVNGLAMNSSVIVAAMGREHRLGRWWCTSGNCNKLLIHRIPNVSDSGDESN